MIDLDFDNALQSDAEGFGIAQGGPGPFTPPETCLSRGESGSTVEVFTPTSSLEQALYVAREVFGETNSVCSTMFCHWVEDALHSVTTLQETKEMLAVLYEEKQALTSYWGRVRYMPLTKSRQLKVQRIEARRAAAICAMNCVRAVLNKMKGLPYAIWVERTLWRASLASEDERAKRYVHAWR